MMKIQLLYPTSISPLAKPIAESLRSADFDVIENPDTFMPDELGLALFTKEMDVEEYLRDVPFLQEQLDYSSIKHLRILPFFIYDGSQDDPEELFEGPTGEFVEEIFSGEFKPYGWDLSSLDNLTELEAIIEVNYAE